MGVLGLESMACGVVYSRKEELQMLKASDLYNYAGTLQKTIEGYNPEQKHYVHLYEDRHSKTLTDTQMKRVEKYATKILEDTARQEFEEAKRELKMVNQILKKKAQ